MAGKKEYWSMTEGAFNCLIDKERTAAFKNAIHNTVKKGDIVVDMGTGSGILAMLAAGAGAKKVYAVEYDENNIRTLENNFKINGFEDKIKLIKGDIRKVKLPEKVDVIIGEMIATGLIEEQQIPAMNNILKYAKRSVRILLKKYECFADLVYHKNDYYGYEFDILRYEYTDVKETWAESFSGKIKHRANKFSNKEKYKIIDFTKIIKDLEINKKLIFAISKNGIINGIRISGKTIFYDNSSFGGSFAYSYPIIIPFKKTAVKRGDRFKVSLKYMLCGGFQNFKYSIKKLNFK